TVSFPLRRQRTPRTAEDHPAGCMIGGVPEVLRCAPSGRERSLPTVVAAFPAAPLLCWVWPDDERYAACAPGFFGLLVDVRLEGGEVWTADGGAAVPMWDPPRGLSRAATRWRLAAA